MGLGFFVSPLRLCVSAGEKIEEFSRRERKVAKVKKQESLRERRSKSFPAKAQRR